MSSEIASLFSLAGKTALVTGGSQGIGREIARLFLAAGARVVIAARDTQKLEATATALRMQATAADAVVALPVDIADESSVLRLFEELDKTVGAIDILVNNAGNTAKHPFLDTTVAQWDSSQQVNLRGPFLCMREAIRRMKAAGKGGAVVNVSSLSGMSTTVFNNAHYGAAKAGLNMLTKNAAIEFVGDGIRINAVLPGGVATEGATKLGGSFKPAGPMTQSGRFPMGRLATPTEVAAAVLYLASPASAYVTGQLLVLDGGYQVS